MTYKESLREAWMKGYTQAKRGNSFGANDLGPRTEKAAKAAFEKWWSLNKEDEAYERITERREERDYKNIDPEEYTTSETHQEHEEAHPWSPR